MVKKQPNRLRRLLLKQLPLLFATSLNWLAPARANNKPWHLQNGGFRNNYIGQIDKPFSDLLKAFSGQRPPRIIFPLATNNPQVLATNRDTPTITWIGHASFLIQLDGINFLTDPHFSERASPVSFAGPKRTTPPGLTIDQLPPIDAILISHNHYDHLDNKSVQQLRQRFPDATFFVPLKLADWSGFAGAPISELDWWDNTKFGTTTISAVPTQHWSNRSNFDRNQTLWCSWVIETATKRVLFVGDAGFSPDFRDIGERFGGFDLAIIPIGAYSPRWFMQEAHQNPEEAAQARRDLNARIAVASHWGTFQLTFEPMEEPPKRLAAALAEAGENADQFWIMQHGQTRNFG